MDFLRGDFLRRGRSSNPQDVEQQGSVDPDRPRVQPEMEQRPQPRTRRFSISRPVIPTMFSGRSANRGGQRVDDGEAESPKTPQFTLGSPTLPGTRLHLPHLTRTWTNGSNGPESRPNTARPTTARPAEGRPSFSRFRSERFPVVAEPAPAARPDRSQPGSRTRRFAGSDPAELHLAEMANDGRRRRRHVRRTNRQPRETPKYFMFCFPWIKSRRIRSQILRCFVSGIFLALLLTVYLALSITKNINNSEFTVLLILIILFITIFFCHGLIRLCMLVVRPRNDEDGRARLPHMMGPGGYAVPREPIRVVLARDEEEQEGGAETTATTEANKLKPPAYGLWRESVRVDPDRLFWQRNPDAAAASESSSRYSGTTAGPRPPSYASDDGVSYVVEARPRSMAPTADVPLPPHPSELGRLAPQRPTW